MESELEILGNGGKNIVPDMRCSIYDIVLDKPLQERYCLQRCGNGKIEYTFIARLLYHSSYRYSPVPSYDHIRVDGCSISTGGFPNPPPFPSSSCRITDLVDGCVISALPTRVLPSIGLAIS